MAIALSLAVGILLGWDLYWPELGQQPSLGLAMVTRSQARQGLPEGVAQPPLHDDLMTQRQGGGASCEQPPSEDNSVID